jgi:tetratricopeptide (TPR) repeat protein
MTTAPDILETTIVIRHNPGSDPASFRVSLRGDANRSRAVECPSPRGFPVKGKPNSDLVRELRWYLEEFLDYPSTPDSERAQYVMEALRKWGEDTFISLFVDTGLDRIFESPPAGPATLRMQIFSDDAAVLSWPWEALRNPAGGRVAETCQIERTLDNIPPSRPAFPPEPKQQLNILLVVARPFGSEDVGFRLIVNPLSTLIGEGNLPVNIHLLRPPTFEHLRQHLAERPRFYHILHFDGHGSFPSTPEHFSRENQAEDLEGSLIFETSSCGPDQVSARRFSALLSDHPVPAVILNACRSAMLDGPANHAFASVATALLGSGIGSVVAMAFALNASGAEQFVPAFYRSLLQDGNLPRSVSAGRRQMWIHPERKCAAGSYSLADWVVPVLYRHETLNFPFAVGATRTYQRTSKLPPGIRREADSLSLVGRDGPLLSLERALLAEPPAIVVEGMAGVGKTELVLEFVRLLDATDGLDGECLWVDLKKTHGVTDIVTTLAGATLGLERVARTVEEELDLIASVFRRQRFILVLDNFEAVGGTTGIRGSGSLSASDLDVLGGFVSTLRGGATKVIITSRFREDWLGLEERSHIPLRGLPEEDRWIYAERVMNEAGLTAGPNNKDVARLVHILGGHPLAMRVLLPRLQVQAANEIVAALLSDLSSLEKPSSEDWVTLSGPLIVREQRLPEELHALLEPVALHKEFVHSSHLHIMSTSVGATFTQADIDAFMTLLSSLGLLHPVSDSIFEIHPVFRGYLRSGPLEPPQTLRDAWIRAFVDVMGRFAEEYVQHQQNLFAMFQENFRWALAESDRLEMSSHACALLQALGVFARKCHDLDTAKKYLESLVRKRLESGNRKAEGETYYQLALTVQLQRDLRLAEGYYRKSLIIAEEHNDEGLIAINYHQLGTIAEERGDFGLAEQCLRRALDINERLGDDASVALGYQALGLVARLCGEFETSTRFSENALAINKKLNNNRGMAANYDHLGSIAEEMGQLATAQELYLNSLVLSQSMSDEFSSAKTYHQLGNVAFRRHDLEQAERWYVHSLYIKERLGNARGAALTHSALGAVALERDDFVRAEQWFHKALKVFYELGEKNLVAQAYYHLGIVESEIKNFDKGKTLCEQALNIWQDVKDELGIARALHQIGIIAEHLQDWPAADKCYRDSLGVYEKLNNLYGIATEQHHLGMMAQERGEFREAAEWYSRALAGEEAIVADDLILRTASRLGTVARQVGDHALAEKSYRRELEVEIKLGDNRGAAITAAQLADLARENGDLSIAEASYLYALTLAELAAADDITVLIHGHLAGVRVEQGNVEAARQSSIEALLIRKKRGIADQGDLRSVELDCHLALLGPSPDGANWVIETIQGLWRNGDLIAARNICKLFASFYQHHPEGERAALDLLWQTAGFSTPTGVLPDGEAPPRPVLEFDENKIPQEARFLLVPLALHTRVVSRGILQAMVQHVDPVRISAVDQLFGILKAAGLLEDLGNGLQTVHPRLLGHLRSTLSERMNAADLDHWIAAFVTMMCAAFVDIAAMEPQEQITLRSVFKENLEYALEQAERLSLPEYAAFLCQVLGKFAIEVKNLAEADNLYHRMSRHASAVRDRDGEAVAYHELGLIARLRSEFEVAEQWYLKSISTKEDRGGGTYQELGTLALERRNFSVANDWYYKSLAIFEKAGDTYGTAVIFYQLGIVAEAQFDLTSAKQHFLKALSLVESQTEIAGQIYYHLGRVRQKGADIQEAEKCYLKALAVAEMQQDTRRAAPIYYQLGMIAQERRDFSAASRWYHTSLAIDEATKNESSAAIVYHQLGRLAEDQKEFGGAELWFRMAIATKEKLGEEHSAAFTYAALGTLKAVSGMYQECSQWLVKAVRAFTNSGDSRMASAVTHNILFFFRSASAADQARVKALWQEAGLGAFPQDIGE